MSVTDVLVDILVVLLAAKAAAEIAERVGVPAVVGEILAGVTVGPAMLDLVGTSSVLEVLGQLGVILLLLEVGLELGLGDLRSVGRSSVSVATIGVILSTLAGMGVTLAFDRPTNTALVVGVALAATSVGIGARVFRDLGTITSVEARTVLGAAIADDVMGLLLLTVVLRIVTAGSVSVVDLVGIVAVALVFLVAAVGLGTRFAPRFLLAIDRRARSAGTFVGVALAFALAFALLANEARLAPIIGAFAAGVALSGSEVSSRVRRELTPVGHLFVPVFFLQIGVQADVDALGDPSVLALVGALLVVACVGKVVAGLGILGAGGDRLLVGLGMLPRGEVTLILASIGLAEGVLDAELYAALVAVVILTTLIAPPLLRVRQGQLQRRRPRRAAGPAPPGGWLRADTEVVLVAEPPDEDAIVVGLDAALLVTRAPPSAGLLDWLAKVDRTAAEWDGRATARLLAVLREGNPRSWRFLEASGLLERSLPEVADAVRRRRADAFVLDPGQVLRFELVESVREVVRADPRAAAAFERLRHPERPLIAALVLALAGDVVDPVEFTRALAHRLRVGGRAEDEVASLVADRELLRGAASRVDGLDEEPVLQVASHLATPERTRALYVLSLAVGGLELWERDRLDELLARVLQVMARPELTGGSAESIVDQRRDAAVRLVGDAPSVAQRVRDAPRAYLLSHPAPDVARHAALVAALPRSGIPRVNVTALAAGEARVEIAARDRPGLLATVSGVLAGRGLDVIGASATTWPDGAVVESFRVRLGNGGATDILGMTTGLAEAIHEVRKVALDAAPAPDLEVDFDDTGSPWYTLCEVRGPDRPGLLHAITVGFAVAGATVHSSRIDTRMGLVIDRFELSDTEGHKLDADLEASVRDAIQAGVEGGQPRGAMRRRRLLGSRSTP